MCICEEKQIRIIIVNGSSLSSAPRRPPENQHAAARAGWSAGTISLVFYVIYLHRAAERSPAPITLRGRRCPGLQNKALHFRLETQSALGLLLHTENKMERVEKEKMEAERQEERLQQWASADRVPY